MRLYAVLPAVIALLQREGRVTYLALKQEFDFDDAFLELVREELIFKGMARDEKGRGLIWIDHGPLDIAPTVATPYQQAAPEPAVAIPPDIGGPEALSAQSAVTRASEPVAPLHTEQLTSLEQDVVDLPSSDDDKPAYSALRTPEAQRRQLTVMFCDLVGSTDLSGRLDPEDLRDVIRAYQESAAEVIHTYEGHIAQYLGDGLLTYFGFPVSHEDDAQRALYAGLGIVDAMGVLNTRLVADYEVQLAVRVGIHTGPVVVGEVGGGDRHENLALGETPNVAARLMELAPSNTVVISNVTARLVQDTFVLNSMGEKELKGVNEPMDVWEVQGLRDLESLEELVEDNGGPPLVGRDEEIGLLLRRWAQSKEGVGQIVLIMGEAGIGKSALLRVARRQVMQEGLPRISFRFSQYHQNSALYPIIEHLQRLLGFESNEAPETKLTKLEQVLKTYHIPLDEVVPLFAELLSIEIPHGRYPAVTLSPQQQRQQMLDALNAWLLEESERQPILVLWEALQWADPTTLELLGSLMDQVPTAAMLNVLTFRPEFVPPWPMRSHMTSLTLNRLERPQVEVMVTRLSGGKPLPTEVVGYIVNKTDGVPLFVEELTKAFLEADILQEEADRYRLRGPLTEVAVPATLKDSLMARLDRLPMVREVAQLAAVLGREFAYEKLQALTGVEEKILQDGLAQLVDTELLYRRGRASQATYSFRHALVQDVAYHSLLRRTREQYHQQVAELLATRYPKVIENEPEVVAHHYTEAGNHDQAVVYWEKAGQRASQLSANLEAVAHFSKGLEVLQNLPDTPERRKRELDMQVALGPVLIAAKGYANQQVEIVYVRARELCEQLEASSAHFVVLRGLEVHYLVRGELQKARGLGKQLLEMAQWEGDAALLVGANHALGQSLYYLGELTAARTHVEQGMALYQPRAHHFPTWPGGHPGEQCFLYGAWILWLLGYPDQALKRSQEALTLIQELSHPFSLASALDFTALLHQFRREPRKAQEHSETAMALCTEQRISVYLEMGRIIRGWALAVQGQSEEGTAQMNIGVAAFRATGAALWCPNFLAMLAEAYGNEGRVEEGLEALDQAFGIADKTQERYYEAELHRLKGELFLQQAVSDALQAETCFQQGLAVARSQEAKSWELRVAMSLSRLWHAQGKKEEAQNLLSEIYGWFTEGFDTADLKDAKALLEKLS
jgi:class 3 adenylate cyclase/predicted ATPase